MGPLGGPWGSPGSRPITRKRHPRCTNTEARAGHILPIKVGTDRQLADIMTKPLPQALFSTMRAQLMNYRDAVYDLRTTAFRRSDAAPAA